MYEQCWYYFITFCDKSDDIFFRITKNYVFRNIIFIAIMLVITCVCLFMFHSLVHISERYWNKEVYKYFFS